MGKLELSRGLPEVHRFQEATLCLCGAAGCARARTEVRTWHKLMTSPRPGDRQADAGQDLESSGS